MRERNSATLYFLRHGEAVDAAGWRGNDFERPLTDGGRERIALEAQAIKGLDLGLDRILTSPLVRAQQTAAIVAGELQMGDALVEDDRLGTNFGLEGLARILHDRTKAHTLMLVGHEPSFSATIGRLIGGAAVDVKKGSLARVDVSGTAELKGELIWLVPPRVLLLGLRLSRAQPATSAGDKVR